MRLSHRAALLIGAASSFVVQAASPPPVYCAVTVIPDNLLVVAYKAVLRLDPTCPSGGVARVRKVSTVNAGLQFPGGLARYGGLWGWTLTRTGDNVPPRELWTPMNRVWNYWDGTRWLPARQP